MATPRELPGAAALPMLDVYLPLMRTAAVLTAGELGLFAALARGALPGSRLAARLDADPHGVARLADLLVLAGYLRRSRGGYALTPHTRRWFTPHGSVDYTPGLRWTLDAFRLTAELGAAVRRGRPRQVLWQRMAKTPPLGEHFAAYMRAYAAHLAPQLARAVRLPAGARSLLDLGGSHGLHAIAFCQRHAQLRAVVLDHAVSLAGTPANVRAHGLSGRISTQAGDLRTASFGRGHDVVLLLSVAHNQDAATNARLFAKCFAALRPGGLLVVHDYVRGVMPAAYNAAFDLTLLLEVGTRTWTQRDFTGWLRRAGFTATRHRTLRPAAMGSLILATKGRTAQRPSPSTRRTRAGSVRTSSGRSR